MGNMLSGLIPPRSAIRFDRNELSGAFGDIGTDLPLIIGMILVSGISPASVLILFGLAQLFSALFYGMPMPVQPLKAVATLVIIAEGSLDGPLICGAGLAIGATMLFLTVTGLIEWLGRIIPLAVVRGIQFGLGAKLSLLAGTYILKDGIPGYILAAVCFTVIVCLLGHRKWPPALLVIGIGLVYAFCFKVDADILKTSFGVVLPQFQIPTARNILEGFLVLALPQIPLSLGNSIFATKQLAGDLFPEKKINLRQIGFTYSLLNIITPFLGGIPVCHGSGGLAGHHAFGGRTGGSVIVYGSLFLVLGLFFSNGFEDVIQIFPLPVLGVILLFEGFVLMRLIADMAHTKFRFSIALLVGLLAFCLPRNGFLIGIIVGTVISYIPRKYNIGIGRS